MKELMEKILGIKLIDKENYTENKTIFGGFLYFFKKELKQDHYFTMGNKAYVLKHNKDNYDISLTETGKLENSFKIPFSKCEIFELHQQKTQVEENKIVFAYIDEPSILDIIKEIQEKLDEVNLNLSKLKRKINE